MLTNTTRIRHRKLKIARETLDLTDVFDSK